MDQNSKHDMDMSRYRDTFQMFDGNGDGFISINELGDAMRLLNQNPTKSELDELMKQVDSDQNGLLDFTEFAELMSNAKFKSTRKIEEEMKAAFEIFDRDGDGVITAKELQYYMVNLGEKMTEKEAHDMVQEADMDGDGKINYREFCQMMTPGYAM